MLERLAGDHLDECSLTCVRAAVKSRGMRSARKEISFPPLSDDMKQK